MMTARLAFSSPLASQARQRAPKGRTVTALNPPRPLPGFGANAGGVSSAPAPRVQARPPPSGSGTVAVGFVLRNLLDVH
jgi:hypothetical protein